VCPDCCPKDLPVYRDRVKLFSTRERQLDCTLAISRHIMSDTRPMVIMSRSHSIHQSSRFNARTVKCDSHAWGQLILFQSNWYLQVLEEVLKDTEKKVIGFQRLQGDSFKRACRQYAAMMSGSAWVLREPFLEEAKNILHSLSAPAGLCLVHAGHIICLPPASCLYVLSHAALMHHACMMLLAKTMQ